MHKVEHVDYLDYRISVDRFCREFKHKIERAGIDIISHMVEMDEYNENKFVFMVSFYSLSTTTNHWYSLSMFFCIPSRIVIYFQKQNQENMLAILSPLDVVKRLELFIRFFQSGRF